MTNIQQEVVNKMKDGYSLRYGYSNDWLMKDNKPGIPVWKQTTNALIKKGIIYDAGKQLYKLVENE